MNSLFTTLLPQAIQSGVKEKEKFALFILDDMVEFLGPEILGQKFIDIAQQIAKFCSSSDAAIRQAASYGIGMIAMHGKDAYAAVNQICMEGLKAAIGYQMPSGVKGKKAKEKKFNYARDNAISALGKIIRYQSAHIDVNSIVPEWLNLLPIKADVEEA